MKIAQPNIIFRKVNRLLYIKTIPIYFGAEELPKEFDERGIIRFDAIEGFKELYNNFDYVYENYLDVIEHNRKIALDYMIPEDRLFKILKV